MSGGYLPKPRDGWLLGVDVSTFQGEITAELAAQLAAYEARFVFARAVHGTTPDRQYTNTIETCSAAGLMVGAYGVLTPKGDADEQARAFVERFEAHPLDLAPALDFETAGGLTGSEALSRARRWLDVVEAELGRGAIVYTGPSFWSGLVKLAGTAGAADAAAVATRPLWVAHYGVHSPIVPRSWEDWTIWQASGNGAARLPGTSREVDVDWYRGTEAELLALGREGQSPRQG